jgi:hypothetical protein
VTAADKTFFECVQRINARRHTRFGVSRRERFETVEKATLKPLLIGDLEYGNWKNATLHPDCYVHGRRLLQHAPHPPPQESAHQDHRELGGDLLTLERLAIRPRSRHKDGKRVFIDAHFPPASQ